MEEELEAAKRLGTVDDVRPTKADVARQRINLLCLPFLAVTAGAAFLQLLTMIVLLPASCFSWELSDWMKGMWLTVLLIIFLLFTVPSVVLSLFVFRRKMLGAYFTEKYQVGTARMRTNGVTVVYDVRCYRSYPSYFRQLFHSLLLALAALSFIAQLAEMTWLGLAHGPPVGNWACDSLSAAVCFNAIVVIVEFVRCGLAGYIFRCGMIA